MSKSKATQPAIQVQISYDPYTLRFYSELDTYLASLRNILKSLKDKTYIETGSRSVKGGFLGLTLIENEEVQTSIENREILNTFVSMMRSFIDFLDALVGIKNILKKPPKLPKSIKTTDELLNYYNQSIEERIQKIARNNTLTNIKKLDSLPKLSAEHDKAIRNYFAIRRAIEHHKSIASKKIQFSVQRQSLFTDKGQELTGAPAVLEGPSTISLKIKWETKVIRSGAGIKLSEKDLEDLVMTFRLRIVPELISKLVVSASKPGSGSS